MSAAADARRVTTGSGIQLGGGRRVTIRPIDPGDGDGLCAFYRGLSTPSRCARFLGAAGGIEDSTLRRFADADHATSDGLVAVLHEQGPDDGTLVGHLCLEPDGAGSNELAVAIADEFRGLGIGKAMVKSAVESARRRGIHRLTASMFATNLPMRRLMLDTGWTTAIDDLDAGVESMEMERAA
jgi:acetyltransferase